MSIFMLSENFKTRLQYFLPKHAITFFFGKLAEIKFVIVKNYFINRFIRKYNVNMQEAESIDPNHYASFNDFFIRQLKPECRPISNADIISPVDGAVSEIGDISEGKLLQAKGRYYTVQELLACDLALSQEFNSGRFATLYLSPKDYHRVHMPLDAKLEKMTYVPGRLFSVNPATARVVPQLFARNERLVAWFTTEIGKMAMVLVGATIVGRIGTSFGGDLKRSHKPMHFDYKGANSNEMFLQKASEMGYFKLGSTVVLLFADNSKMHWRQDLKAGDPIRFGEALGGK